MRETVLDLGATSIQELFRVQTFFICLHMLFKQSRIYFSELYTGIIIESSIMDIIRIKVNTCFDFEKLYSCSIIEQYMVQKQQ